MVSSSRTSKCDTMLKAITDDIT